MTKQKFTCPRCKKETNCYPAVSRRDNKTEICSDCSEQEAMFDFMIEREMQLERGWLMEIQKNDTKTK